VSTPLNTKLRTWIGGSVAPALRPAQVFGIRYLRVLVAFFHLDVYRKVELHAQALTMKTLLSLVPFVAVCLALFGSLGQGVGDTNRLMIETLVGYFSGSEQLQEQILNYINTQNIQDAKLGSFSVVVLMMTVMSLLNHIENTFNGLFGVMIRRSIGSRLITYWALLTLGPLLLMSSVGLTAAIQSSNYISSLEVVGFSSSQLLNIASLLLTWLAFFVVYVGVPNTRVQIWPAIVAAFVAGTLWDAAKYGFAWYASANVTIRDLYGSLAAFPMFILWVYLSWVLLLAGMQLCFNLQHSLSEHVEQNMEMTQSLKEHIALRLLLEIGHRFYFNNKSLGSPEYATHLGLPLNIIEDVVENLRRNELVQTTEEYNLVPAKPLNAMRVEEVMTLMCTGENPSIELHRGILETATRDILKKISDARQETLGEITLYRLVEELGDRDLGQVTVPQDDETNIEKKG
jgi:membrane protein